MPENVKILLVDDEDDLLSTMEFRLSALGYVLSIARNGEEALARMNQEKADVVVADFMMPEINGIELTRIIKSHPLWFDTQVVLFSCNTEPEFRRKALDLGALEYLPKTVGVKAIVERICKIAPLSHGAPASAGPSTTGAASLARGLADMLQVAAGDESLSGSTRLAISSSQRIAGDLVALLAETAPNATEH